MKLRKLGTDDVRPVVAVVDKVDDDGNDIRFYWVPKQPGEGFDPVVRWDANEVEEVPE